MYKASDFIQKLKLEKHIEGGSFIRVYESKHKIPITGYSGNRNISTSIYFLLEGNDFSAFHRLKSDEIWAFNYGAPLTIYIINENGELRKIILGDPENPVYQTTIHANQWFAAEVNDKSSFTLVSCFVSPGFEYSDFELGDRNVLTNQYPKYANLIDRLARNNKTK